MTKLILSFVTVLLIVSCHEPKDTADCHYKIKIKNNTDKVLLLDTSDDSLVYTTDRRLYKREESVKPYAGNGEHKIGSIHFIGGGKPTCVEDLLDNNQSMYLFLFDSVAIANKTWNEIRQQNLFAKRYKIKLEDLKKNNFTVEFDEK